MKYVLKSRVIVSLGIILLMCAMMSVQAAEYTLNDQTNDVYYIAGSAGDTQTDISDKPNIDITKVMYSTTSNSVSITIEVVGSIQQSAQVLYYGEYESADALYQFTYSDNNVNAMVEYGGQKGPVEPAVQASGNSLKVTFDLASDDTSLENLYAYGHYYEDADLMMMGPKFIDTTADIDNPDMSDGGQTSNDNSGGSLDSTPGFELVVMLCAVVFVSIFLYKKK